jgi:hypothetical protein
VKQVETLSEILHYYKKHLFINELSIMFEYDENYSSQMIDFLGNFALKNDCNYLVTYDVYKHENIYFYRFLEENSFDYGNFSRQNFLKNLSFDYYNSHHTQTLY